ncbi:MAG TPA: hypothetical protein VMV99_07020 [Rhodanobacter sp.]|nr:hypothetical protein [Rhodanobacter sp.]
MNNTRFYLLSAMALALSHWGAPAMASEARSSSGLDEIPNEELATMRGRYTISDNTVAWFGVKMISTWKTPSEQLLQSTLALNMDFTHGTPKITFQPSVTITSANAQMPLPAPNAPSRSVTGAGLANVSGVVQSTQVAGDGNVASNVTSLAVHDGGSAPSAPPSPGSNDATSGIASVTSNGASAVASFDGKNAGVLLTIDGQGAVSQWIHNGSLGQSVQLTADNQAVSNSMQIELIRQATSINSQLSQNVAQAINLARTMGRIY